MKDKKILRKISQGMYILTTKGGGCFVDAVSQISAGDNPLIAVAVMKTNYTNELIKTNKKFAISVLGMDVDMDIVKTFGFNSMRDINKFENVETTEVNEIKIINDSLGYMVCEIIERIDNLTDVDLRGEIIKEAIKDFPMDFRIQLRLMGHLYFSCEDSQVKERLPKIKSIYDNIQQNCTVDTIRIRAKRYMASCYACLSKIEGSGVDFEECEKILKDMPYMRDGKEFVKAIFYPEDHPSYYENIKNSIDVSAGLLASGLGRFYWDDNFSVDYKIKVQNMSIDILNMIYDDGNYGSQWREIMYLYLELGHLYHMKGDNEKAVLNLKKKFFCAFSNFCSTPPQL